MTISPCLKNYVDSLCRVTGGNFHRIVRLHGKDMPMETRVNDFDLGKTPVTWRLWLEYCQATSNKPPDLPPWAIDLDDPVVNVSWFDIMRTGGFCTWVTRETSIDVSLPTQCQWQYAATQGNIKNVYPWGARFDTSKLWCSLRQHGDVKRTASTIRRHRNYVNRFGIADLVGNVGQWCFDFYTPDADAELLPSSIRRNLRFRLITGGNWQSDYPPMFQTSMQNWNHYQERNDHTGFRLVASRVRFAHR